MSKKIGDRWTVEPYGGYCVLDNLQRFFSKDKKKVMVEVRVSKITTRNNFTFIADDNYDSMEGDLYYWYSRRPIVVRNDQK